MCTLVSILLLSVSVSAFRLSVGSFGSETPRRMPKRLAADATQLGFLVPSDDAKDAAELPLFERTFDDNRDAIVGAMKRGEDCRFRICELPSKLRHTTTDGPGLALLLLLGFAVMSAMVFRFS